MSQNDGIQKLKGILIIYIIAHLFYGISFLLFPGFIVSISGSPDPVGLTWLRWSGGPLAALAVGAIAVYRNPAGQHVFLNVALASALFVGLGLLYSWLFDHSTSAAWFHLTPCVVNLALFFLLLWARQGAKEALA